MPNTTFAERMNDSRRKPNHNRTPAFGVDITMRVRPTIAQLGYLVRTYREQRGLTQDRFVSELPIRTNRSSVAHLEQGLRLPPPQTLHAICTYLNIPEALWYSFESNHLRQRLNRLPSSLYHEGGPRTIAVSGIMGAGKTTLARNVAARLGLQYIGENVQGIAYLNDLVSDPRRWAFETQLAFLSEKALEILKALDQHPTVIVDRWISEDVEVFADYFYSQGFIDVRSFEIYKNLANYFLQTIESPDMIILCDIDVPLALERIQTRTRHDMFLHTPEHLSEIANRYDSWISRQMDTRILKVDSEVWDWRAERHLLQICGELEYELYGNQHNESQLDFFLETDNSPDLGVNYIGTTNRALELVRDHRWLPRQTTIPGMANFGPLPYPSAYVAAPFTTVAQGGIENEHDLFDGSGPHGTIPPGRYRRALLSIERGLRRLGIHTLLPHRDVNEWGMRKLSPSQVVSLCTSQVARSDFFVGILGMSHGSHYEFGLARARDIPSIIVHCRELSESFIANGVESEGTGILSLEVGRLRDIEKVLLDEKVKAFVMQHI